MAEPHEQESEEPQEQELKPEDVKDKKAKAFVRRVIKTLANLINETDNEELKRLTHHYIYCFKNFYTLVEMARYMTARYKVHVNSVIQIFQNAFLNNDWGCHPYWAYSSQGRRRNNINNPGASSTGGFTSLSGTAATSSQL